MAKRDAYLSALDISYLYRMRSENAKDKQDAGERMDDNERDERAVLMAKLIEWRGREECVGGNGNQSGDKGKGATPASQRPPQVSGEYSVEDELPPEVPSVAALQRNEHGEPVDRLSIEIELLPAGCPLSDSEAFQAAIRARQAWYAYRGWNDPELRDLEVEKREV